MEMLEAVVSEQSRIPKVCDAEWGGSEGIYWTPRCGFLVSQLGLLTKSQTALPSASLISVLDLRGAQAQTVGIVPDYSFSFIPHIQTIGKFCWLVLSCIP